MSSDLNRPNLSLSDPPGRLRRPARGVPRGWLIALLLLQLATLGVLVYVFALRGQRGPAPSGAAATESGADQRALALELENRSLYAQAAETWQDYLRGAPQAQDRAEVWFRTGRLFMQAEQFDRAAAALLRCEQAAEDNAELRRKVGPEIVNCLRRLGLYGEVGRELSRRVEAGAEDVKKGKTLATLAGEPLTEADLDRLIERRVDQMLALQGAAGNESVRQQLLGEFARPETRRQLFEELLQTELFTRRARELGLDKEQDYLAARQALEDNLLAARFQTRELAKIQPTDVDLEALYKSRETEYREPEELTAWIEELKADDKPQAILEGIKSAGDFRQWQKKHRGDVPPDGPAAAPETLIRGRPHPQLGDTNALFGLEAGQWTKEPVVNDQKRYLIMVEGKSPARTPPLEEIRDRVRADYIARKREEIARRLSDDLMERYQVKIEPWDETPPAEAPKP
ncbi:MAG: peptidyl-prolyl cis-trans isomerase [Pirellulaceae bacterium]|nr:peptidyl-prolyl cis-trans isomerase [Pirellulaceae bacterium]